MIDWSRRDALRLGTVSALPIVAGCSGLGGGSPTGPGTPDPDAGTDRYGIALSNTAATDVRARVKATQPFDEEPVKWSKTLDLPVGAEHEWSGILTEAAEYSVVAHIEDALDGQPDDRGKQKAFADNMWITPGSDNAPAVPNVYVEVFDHESTSYPWVRITAEE